MLGHKGHRTKEQQQGEDGYVLLAALVAIALVLIALSVAATKVAFQLKREREEESVRRANQYVRAVREYYLKYHQYPASVEQLENTNTIRFLRKQYVDPLTGKPDWRLIHVGQNKTQVTGFFGEPLTGLPTSGLGAAAGMQSPGIGGSTPGAAGTAQGTAGTAGTAAAGTAAAAGTTSATGASGSTGAFSSSGTFSSTGTGAGGLGSGIGSQSATSFQGGGGPIMGVGSSATGNSILEINAQNTYETWEFLYDPRLELLKQKRQMNSGIGSTNAGSLGQTPGSFGSSNTNNGINGTTTPGSGTPGSTPPATSGTGTHGSQPTPQP